MPWHTKLGFTTGPCVSTLNHLSPDGGVVTALDFVITKVKRNSTERLRNILNMTHLAVSHCIPRVRRRRRWKERTTWPVERARRSQAQREMEGEWHPVFQLSVTTLIDFFFLFLLSQRRYEMEASKLRTEYEKKATRYEGYIDRLERKAGHSFRPGENGMLLITLFCSSLR